jgi:hypothetical protein
MEKQLLVSKLREADPGRRRADWRGFALSLALLTVFAVTVVFLVAALAPSAGAAGGCGGG